MMAHARRKLTGEVMLHSDRDSLDFFFDCQALLKRHGVVLLQRIAGITRSWKASSARQAGEKKMGWKLIRWLLMMLYSASLQVVQADEIVHAISCECPPYVNSVMPGEGVMVKFVRELITPMGYELRVMYVPWARVYVEKEKYDLVMGVWPEEVKKMKLESFTPLFLSRIGFFTRRDTHIDVSSLAALGDRTVGITRGYGYPPALFQSRLRLDPANDDVTNLLKLEAKRFDLFITEQAQGDYLLKTVLPKLRGKILWNEPAYAEMPLGLAIVPTSKLREKLKRDLPTGLKLLKSKGRDQKIVKEYAIDVSLYGDN